MMSSQTLDNADDTCVVVDPGACGFTCAIRVKRIDKRSVSVKIEDSECKQIQSLNERLGQLTLRELFMPLTQNPVYLAAQASRCHASCAIPCAVIKAVEVAMGMAVARQVRFSFETKEPV
jgi:hypothetical protein